MHFGKYTCRKKALIPWNVASQMWANKSNCGKRGERCGVAWKMQARVLWTGERLASDLEAVHFLCKAQPSPFLPMVFLWVTPSQSHFYFLLRPLIGCVTTLYWVPASCWVSIWNHLEKHEIQPLGFKWWRIRVDIQFLSYVHRSLHDVFVYMRNCWVKGYAVFESFWYLLPKLPFKKILPIDASTGRGWKWLSWWTECNLTYDMVVIIFNSSYDHKFLRIGRNKEVPNTH